MVLGGYAVWGVLWDSGPVEAAGGLQAQEPQVMARLAAEAVRLGPGMGAGACFHQVAEGEWQERAADRRRLAEPYGDDVLFVTFLWNAEQVERARGFAIHYRPECQRSVALARHLVGWLKQRLAPYLPAYNWAGMWVAPCPLLLAAPGPALRILPGFVTNPTDRALFVHDGFHQRFVDALVSGLALGLGLRFEFRPGPGWLNRDLTLPSGASAGELRGALSGTVLGGLEGEFLAAEQEAGVSALYLCAHALREVGIWCDLARIKHNVLAWGCHWDKNYEHGERFASKAECIRVVAPALRREFLSPDAPRYWGRTLKGVGMTYSFDLEWPYQVAATMERIRPTQTRGWWSHLLDMIGRSGLCDEEIEGYCGHKGM